MNLEHSCPPLIINLISLPFLKLNYKKNLQFIFLYQDIVLLFILHTEASKGGVCLYISVDIDFKPRNDLKFMKAN